MRTAYRRLIGLLLVLVCCCVLGASVIWVCVSSGRARACACVENATRTDLKAIAVTGFYYEQRENAEGQARITVSRFIDDLAPSGKECLSPSAPADFYLLSIKFTSDGQAFVYEPHYPEYISSFSFRLYSIRRGGFIDKYFPGDPDVPMSVERARPAAAAAESLEPDADSVLHKEGQH